MKKRSKLAYESFGIEADIRRPLIHEINRRFMNGERAARGLDNFITFLVAMRLWDTPVLIPNTMVKT